MNEPTDDPMQSNPYSPEAPASQGALQDDSSSTSSLSNEAHPRIRMWPAVAIVIATWLLVTVPGKIAPLTMMHFASMQLAPALGVISLSVWWLASRRVAWRQRWTRWLIVLGTAIAAIVFSHGSMTITMLVYGIPVAMTILVASLALLSRVQWDRRRRVSYGLYAAFLVAALCFRISQIDAAFAFTLAPRWAPTAEEQFLAELKEAGNATTSETESYELPDNPSPTDWAEFRGPQRNGVLPNTVFSLDWDANPPTQLWRQPVGPGWSSFCVVAPLAFTQEQRGDQETVVAYRIKDGSQVWATSIPARFEASMGGIGPRATPTYAEGRLYVTGATGVVQCLDAKSGQSMWNYNMVDELKIRTPDWGFSSSPLIFNDLAIVFAGGGLSKAVIALERESGKVRWTSSDGTHAYGSPQLSTIDGQQHLLISSNLGLRGLDASDGSVLWKHDWDIGQFARVTQPLVAGNAVFLGTGYGNGTMRVDVSYSPSDGWQTTEQWITKLKPYFNDFVYHEGHLYGFDNEIFVSIDAETGERNWKRGRYGYGQVLLIEDLATLLVITEKGKLVLLAASPDGHEELAELQAIEGISWNHPVIADGKLFVRNAEEAACYALPEYKFQLPTP